MFTFSSGGREPPSWDEGEFVRERASCLLMFSLGCYGTDTQPVPLRQPASSATHHRLHVSICRLHVALWPGDCVPGPVRSPPSPAQESRGLLCRGWPGEVSWGTSSGQGLTLPHLPFPGQWPREDHVSGEDVRQGGSVLSAELPV